jgi:signal transduction histidine kinase
MRSTFSRQFGLTAGMILLSFVLLGCSFSSLFYNYMLREEKTSLSTNAQAVSSYVSTQNTLTEVSDWDLRLSVSYGANVSGTDVLICDTTGKVTMCACKDFICEHQGKLIPETMRLSMDSSGFVYETGTLAGIYEDDRYLYGVPVLSATDGSLLGYVLVSTETKDMSTMMTKIIGLFLLTAIVVLLIAMVATVLLTRRQTEMLRDMAGAARQFAHGDFSARIYADGADEEVTELATAFNNMATSLERSESLRQEFISNVSHELKTPMTTIAGFMDGMLDGTIPQEKHAYYMATVSNEVKRLSRLVRSMLDISRLQSTGEAIQKSRFDVTETLGRTLLSFEQKIEEKQLDVQVDMPEKAVYVMANEDSITQVIYNLIDNGVKFAEKETPFLLTVAVSGGKALVSIGNHGPTIPPEELPLVFDRFHKSDKSRSMDKTGVGLGLYIVKTILGSHGEDITVESREGLTTFTFTLELTK